MELRVVKLNENAILPQKAHENDAGFDLSASERLVIAPGETGLVRTGIAIKVPALDEPLAVYARIAPRSGFSSKTNSSIGAGVIDEGYAGELRVLLMNHGSNDLVIEAGQRIAQLILEVMVRASVREVTALETTERGSKGFGSSGI